MGGEAVKMTGLTGRLGMKGERTSRHQEDSGVRLE